MHKSLENLRVFCGNGNRALAQAICDYLSVPLGRANVASFADGEINLKIGENIRGRDVFIVQPTCPPVNDNLMELLLMADAAKRGSAASITAVIPYYGYARQDRKAQARTPISAKLVADLIQTAGIQRVMSVDLHANQIQGFFNIAVDNLYGANAQVSYLRENIVPLARDPESGKSTLVIVSPDAGGAERVRYYAGKLGAKMAMVDKRRDAPNEAQVMNVIGKVNGKDCVLLDDMVDTAGSLTKAAAAIKELGANRVWACCTHALLSRDAVAKIEDSAIERLVVTDSVPLNENARNCKKIEVVSVAELLGEAIRRLVTDESISELFS